MKLFKVSYNNLILLPKQVKPIRGCP